MTPDGDLLVDRELAGALSSTAIAASALGKGRRGRLEPAVDRPLADDHHPSPHPEPSGESRFKRSWPAQPLTPRQDKPL
jgi:hypothetical protein